MKNKKYVVLITGPSGVGKGTVLKKLLSRRSDLVRPVTTTTRNPRPGEVDGKDYNFVSKQQFQEMIESEEMFEWVEFRHNLYGTPRKTIEDLLERDEVVVWETEVAGGIEIIRRLREQDIPVMSVFITLETIEDVIDRLRDRNTEDEKGFAWSVEQAKWQFTQVEKFDHVIVNADGALEDSVDTLDQLIDGFVVG